MQTSTLRYRLSKLYEALCWLLWAGAAFLLPVTSFPLLVRLTGASTVASPSAFLLSALVVIWLVPYLLRGGEIPVEGAPLVFFITIVVFSWAAGFFTDMPSFRGRGPLAEAPEAFATFILGMAAFFVPAAWLSSDRAKFRRTLQIINLGGVVLLIWSLIQAVFVLTHRDHFPLELELFQRLFSVRQGTPLIVGRISGFAYEPSWLAHQLNIIYLPLWLSATFHGYSVYRWRLWRISLENLLLVAGVFVLFLSFSRVGWLSFLLVLMLSSLALTLRLAQRLHGRLLPGVGGQKVSKLGLSITLALALLVVYILAIVGLVYAGAKYEARLARILNRNILNANNLYEVLNNLEFAERVIYWETGLRTLEGHPLFGVGLGNSGFFFSQNVPDFGWMLPEVTRILNYQAFIPNTKSLWVRILAETGLVGFAIFLSWYYLLYQSGLLVRRNPDPLLKTVGVAGLFMLTAFFTEGFSMDSFALPYFWLAAGMLAAARKLHVQR